MKLDYLRLVSGARPARPPEDIFLVKRLSFYKYAHCYSAINFLILHEIVVIITIAESRAAANSNVYKAPRQPTSCEWIHDRRR